MEGPILQSSSAATRHSRVVSRTGAEGISDEELPDSDDRGLDDRDLPAQDGDALGALGKLRADSKPTEIAFRQAKDAIPAKKAKDADPPAEEAEKVEATDKVKLSDSAKQNENYRDHLLLVKRCVVDNFTKQDNIPVVLKEQAEKLFPNNGLAQNLRILELLAKAGQLKEPLTDDMIKVLQTYKLVGQNHKAFQLEITRDKFGKKLNPEEQEIVNKAILETHKDHFVRGVDRKALAAKLDLDEKQLGEIEKRYNAVSGKDPEENKSLTWQDTVAIGTTAVTGIAYFGLAGYLITQHLKNNSATLDSSTDSPVRPASDPSNRRTLDVARNLVDGARSFTARQFGKAQEGLTSLIEKARSLRAAAATRREQNRNAEPGAAGGGTETETVDNRRSQITQAIDDGLDVAEKHDIDTAAQQLKEHWLRITVDTCRNRHGIRIPGESAEQKPVIIKELEETAAEFSKNLSGDNVPPGLKARFEEITAPTLTTIREHIGTVGFGRCAFNAGYILEDPSSDREQPRLSRLQAARVRDRLLTRLCANPDNFTSAGTLDYIARELRAIGEDPRRADKPVVQYLINLRNLHQTQPDQAQPHTAPNPVDYYVSMMGDHFTADDRTAIDSARERHASASPAPARPGARPVDRSTPTLPPVRPTDPFAATPPPGSGDPAASPINLGRDSLAATPVPEVPNPDLASLSDPADMRSRPTYSDVWGEPSAINLFDSDPGPDTNTPSDTGVRLLDTFGSGLGRGAGPSSSGISNSSVLLDFGPGGSVYPPISNPGNPARSSDSTMLPSHSPLDSGFSGDPFDSNYHASPTNPQTNPVSYTGNDSGSVVMGSPVPGRGDSGVTGPNTPSPSSSVIIGVSAAKPGDSRVTGPNPPSASSVITGIPFAPGPDASNTNPSTSNVSDAIVFDNPFAGIGGIGGIGDTRLAPPPISTTPSDSTVSNSPAGPSSSGANLARSGDSTVTSAPVPVADNPAAPAINLPRAGDSNVANAPVPTVQPDVSTAPVTTNDQTRQGQPDKTPSAGEIEAAVENMFRTVISANPNLVLTDPSSTTQFVAELGKVPNNPIIPEGIIRDICLNLSLDPSLSPADALRELGFDSLVPQPAPQPVRAGTQTPTPSPGNANRPGEADPKADAPQPITVAADSTSVIFDENFRRAANNAASRQPQALVSLFKTSVLNEYKRLRNLEEGKSKSDKENMQEAVASQTRVFKGLFAKMSTVTGPRPAGTMVRVNVNNPGLLNQQQADVCNRVINAEAKTLDTALRDPNTVIDVVVTRLAPADKDTKTATGNNSGAGRSEGSGTGADISTTGTTGSGTGADGSAITNATSGAGADASIAGTAGSGTDADGNSESANRETTEPKDDGADSGDGHSIVPMTVEVKDGRLIIGEAEGAKLSLQVTRDGKLQARNADGPNKGKVVKAQQVVDLMRRHLEDQITLAEAYNNTDAWIDLNEHLADLNRNSTEYLKSLVKDENTETSGNGDATFGQGRKETDKEQGNETDRTSEGTGDHDTQPDNSHAVSDAARDAVDSRTPEQKAEAAAQAKIEGTIANLLANGQHRGIPMNSVEGWRALGPYLEDGVVERAFLGDNPNPALQQAWDKLKADVKDMSSRQIARVAADANAVIITPSEFLAGVIEPNGQKMEEFRSNGLQHLGKIAGLDLSSNDADAHRLAGEALRLYLQENSHLYSEEQAAEITQRVINPLLRDGAADAHPTESVSDVINNGTITPIRDILVLQRGISSEDKQHMFENHYRRQYARDQAQKGNIDSKDADKLKELRKEIESEMGKCLKDPSNPLSAKRVFNKNTADAKERYLALRGIHDDLSDALTTDAELNESRKVAEQKAEQLKEEIRTQCWKDINDEKQGIKEGKENLYKKRTGQLEKATEALGTIDRQLAAREARRQKSEPGSTEPVLTSDERRTIKDALAEKAGEAKDSYVFVQRAAEPGQLELLRFAPSAENGLTVVQVIDPKTGEPATNKTTGEIISFTPEEMRDRAADRADSADAAEIRKLSSEEVEPMLTDLRNRLSPEQIIERAADRDTKAGRTGSGSMLGKLALLRNILTGATATAGGAYAFFSGSSSAQAGEAVKRERTPVLEDGVTAKSERKDSGIAQSNRK